MGCFGYNLNFMTHWMAEGSTLSEWDYDHHHTKPEDWKGICKFGNKQSPININTHQTVKVKIQKPFTMHGYAEKFAATVKNNGHTLVMEFGMGSKNKWIEGGGLPGKKFVLKQSHFHWGSTNNQGSEHTINNVYLPMEMHLVHWNKEVVETYEDAIKQQHYNSLAVLAIHFKIGKSNKKFDPLFKSARKVRMQGQHTKIEQDIILEDFLPHNVDKFYRYNGSLTTPGCNEIVVWTIFKESVEISQDQMDYLRTTTYVHKGESGARALSNNYRPTQPLHDRNVADVKIRRLHAKTHDENRTDVFDNSKGLNSDERGTNVEEKSTNDSPCIDNIFLTNICTVLMLLIIY